MSRLRRMIGNTFISLLGQAVTWSSTLILTMAYGRFLGDEKFGELYFAITFVTLIGFPVESGFNQQLTRDVAQDPEKALKYLTNTLLIKLGLWVVLYGGLLWLAWMLGYSDEVRLLIAVCGIALLSTSLATTFGSLHYAFERVVFPVVGTILEKGLSAALGVVLLKFGADVQVMAFILLGGSLASLLWQAYWFLRLVGFHIGIDLSLIRSLFKTSLPFLTYGILGVIYYRLDTFMLERMADTTVVGWYGAGYRLFDTLVFLPSLFVGAIVYPVLSKLSVGQEHQLKLAIEKCLNFLLFCSMPIVTLLIVAAPAIIGFLYHRPEFINTIPALQALAPGLVFLYANSLFASTIMSTHNEKRIMLMAGIALIFNVALNIYFIPTYQHIGAAAVTTLTEFLLLCLSILFTPRKLLPIKSLWVAAKILVACLVMAGAIWLLHTAHIFLILPVAGISFLVTALLIQAIPREDLQILIKAVRKKADKSDAAETDIVTDFSIAAISTAKLPNVDVPIANILLPEEETTVKLPSLKKRKTIPISARPTLKLPHVQPAVSIGDEPTTKLPRLKKRTMKSETV